MSAEPVSFSQHKSLLAIRRILGLFTQETDAEDAAAAILQILLNLTLIDSGLIVYRHQQDAIFTVQGRGARSVNRVEPTDVIDLFLGLEAPLFRVPPERNPLEPKPGLGLTLSGAPQASGCMILALPDPEPAMTSEEWVEIASSTAWALERMFTCQRLEVSHARYHRLFERAEDFLFVSTEAGKCLECNLAGVAMLGFRNKMELMAVPDLRELYRDPADRDRLMAELQTHGVVKAFPTSMVRRNGEVIDVLITAARWEEPDGEAGLEGIIRDVTEANRNVRALHLAEQTMAGVIEGTPVAMFVLDERHRVLHWNRACEALTGVPRDRVLGGEDHARAFGAAAGETMADLLLDGDLDRLRRLYGLKALAPSPMVPGGYVAQDRLTGPDGRDTYLYVSAAPIHDQAGHPQGAVQVVLDITDRIHLEQELMASEAKYRQMVDQALDGIVIHDNQAVHFANRRFRNMFEISEDETLAGAHLHRFLAPVTRRALFEAHQSAVHPGQEPAVFEGWGLRRDGTWFDIELSSVATTYQGSPAIQTVLRDITRRKHMEEQLIHSERLMAAGRLALNIAHEINNPLGGIITYTHLHLEDLSEGQPLDQLLDTTQKVLKLANRCKIIVGGLLDFARPDTDGREESDLNAIVEETLSLLKGHIIMDGLTIDLDLDRNLPLILAQRTKIEQVFMNLIINAAEAMKQNGRLGLRSYYVPEKGTVVVEISDTGSGLTEDDRRRLFEPFFSTKPRGRGTGLGLAISHGIIKQHKGSIEVASEPGNGTTFSIHLPAPTPDPPVCSGS